MMVMQMLLLSVEKTIDVFIYTDRWWFWSGNKPLFESICVIDKLCVLCLVKHWIYVCFIEDYVLFYFFYKILSSVYFGHPCMTPKETFSQKVR